MKLSYKNGNNIWSVMVRITERLTLSTSRPSGKQQTRQCSGKAILTPQYSCKLCDIHQTQAATYVCSGSKWSQTPHSPHYLRPSGKANADFIRENKSLLNGVPTLNLVIHSVVTERLLHVSLPANDWLCYLVSTAVQFNIYQQKRVKST